MAGRARAEALLEHAQDVVTVLDEDGIVTYVSPAAETVLGFSPDELVGRDVFAHVHPDDRAATRAAFAEAVASGERREIQHRQRTADGDWMWLESVVSGERDDDLGGFVVTARDISARREARREQRRTRERLQELTDRAQDVLWMFSADWMELLFVNSAYETIYGGSVETLRADPSSFLDNVHPDDREDVQAAMARLSAGERVDIEYRVNPGEDYGRWVWVQGEPVFEDGEVVRVVGFTRDVTQRAESHRQLQVLDRVLRHNLHNDMNVVLGYAEEARDDCPSDGCNPDLDAVIERGRSLVRTVDKQRQIVELLDPVPSREVVDLARVARAAAHTVQDRYPEATVAVDVPRSAPVRAIPELSRAVEELLDNAVKHADTAAPTVQLAVREDGDETTLTVVDDGPGIPDREITVLTGDQEADPLYHGSGLGLWLVNLVVQRSEGDLAFEPNDPRGSEVRVCLEREAE